jgi:hypothetical protein
MTEVASAAAALLQIVGALLLGFTIWLLAVTPPAATYGSERAAVPPDARLGRTRSEAQPRRDQGVDGGHALPQRSAASEPALPASSPHQHSVGKQDTDR